MIRGDRSFHGEIEVRIELVRGDITEQDVDAIVNAANHTLMGGGGVDGAIHRKGGPEILEECKRIRRDRHPDGLPTGQAAATTAGRLPAKWVIHTVGPVYSKTGDESAELASCHVESLRVADELGAETVAFPAISTGIYAFPADRAARIAVGTVVSELSADPRALRRAVFCCFSEDSARHHMNAFAELGLA